MLSHLIVRATSVKTYSTMMLIIEFKTAQPTKFPKTNKCILNFKPKEAFGDGGGSQNVLR